MCFQMQHIGEALTPWDGCFDKGFYVPQGPQAVLAEKATNQ